MKRVLREFNNSTCCMCNKDIDIKYRKWEPNDTHDKIVGIAFMTEDGEPVEGFDLCDECISWIYSRMIY